MESQEVRLERVKVLLEYESGDDENTRRLSRPYGRRLTKRRDCTPGGSPKSISQWSD